MARGSRRSRYQGVLIWAASHLFIFGCVGLHAHKTSAKCFGSVPHGRPKLMSQRVAKTASFGVVLSLAILHAARAAPPVVQTAEGPVVGRVQGGVRVFTGIPYADAPVGELRFHPPRSHSHWTETLDATREAPACPQTAGSAIGRPSENEDCLYLNVWAPRAGAQQLYPVMVWIHGSGDKGYGGSPYFDGLRLARDNDVVIVTINYRLGLLGSLVSPALDGAHGGQKSGNYHLRDQQEALRWVQRNARAFGGDPRSVTVFGESPLRIHERWKSEQRPDRAPIAVRNPLVDARERASLSSDADVRNIVRSEQR